MLGTTTSVLLATARCVAWNDFHNTYPGFLPARFPGANPSGVVVLSALPGSSLGLRYRPASWDNAFRNTASRRPVEDVCRQESRHRPIRPSARLSCRNIALLKTIFPESYRYAGIYGTLVSGRGFYAQCLGARKRWTTRALGFLHPRSCCRRLMVAESFKRPGRQ